MTTKERYTGLRAGGEGDRLTVLCCVRDTNCVFRSWGAQPSNVRTPSAEQCKSTIEEGGLTSLMDFCSPVRKVQPDRT